MSRAAQFRRRLLLYDNLDRGRAEARRDALVLRLAISMVCHRTTLHRTKALRAGSIYEPNPRMIGSFIRVETCCPLTDPSQWFIGEEDGRKTLWDGALRQLASAWAIMIFSRGLW